MKRRDFRILTGSGLMSAAAIIFYGKHQDGVFNHGINFVTCWVPLMDIDQTIGGLAAVPGSHKRS